MNDVESTILYLLETNPKGLTWKQLEKFLNVRGFEVGHGTISGSLSTLHQMRQVFYLKDRHDDGCLPYVHAVFRENYPAFQRADKPRSNRWRLVSESMYEALTSDDPNKVETAITLYEQAENRAN